tara:strand:- start:781 stop:1815 length:1035 start_codon:yes stop_codon:yes gene_type:complete
MISISDKINSILVTGGSGFIGSALVRKLLKETNIKVFNLDKLGYSSHLNIFDPEINSNQYQLINIDLFDANETKKAIKLINPDLVFHLAAESHVDKSITAPKKFLESNVIGTFNLLDALLIHWESLSESRKSHFRILHVSTDEVFGSIDNDVLFSEETRYDPRSPYSATKAASDHLVRSWNNTYGLPSIITYSCNNFGPWQFPEKLIPVIIGNCLSNKSIPIYGDGKYVRDWIYVEDHIDALIQVILKGKIGESYCIGARQLKTNVEVVRIICDFLDVYKKENAPHIKLIKYIKDRPGHDRRYAIDNKKISKELQWTTKYNFNEAIDLTVRWYLDHPEWLHQSI